MNLVRTCAFATGAFVAVLGTAVSAASVEGGRVAANAPVRLAIAMRARDAAGLSALVRAQADPASPLFRHFLTQAQLRDTFSPSALAYPRTLATLRAQGFTVTRTSPLRLAIDVVAPARLVERTFATRLARVVTADRRVTIAAASAYTIPAALRGDVARVEGLKAAPLFQAAYVAQVGRPHKRSGSPLGPGSLPARNLPLPAATPAPIPTYGPDGGYGPTPPNRAFDFPVLHGYFGSGVRVAEIIDGVVATSTSFRV